MNCINVPPSVSKSCNSDALVDFRSARPFHEVLYTNSRSSDERIAGCILNSASPILENFILQVAHSLVIAFLHIRTLLRFGCDEVDKVFINERWLLRNRVEWAVVFEGIDTTSFLIMNPEGTPAASPDELIITGS